MKTLLVLAVLLPSFSLHAEEVPAAAPSATKIARVAFAQYCFWTGEMKLGQIEGVVRTEAGYFQGQEVTLVEYEPARISLDPRGARQRSWRGRPPPFAHPFTI